MQQLVVSHFDCLSDHYDVKSTNRKNYLEAINQRILSLLSRTQSLRVLDVGTGTGTRAEDLRRRIPDLEFYACDISSKMVLVAKTKELDGIVLADMRDLPYLSESFDAILCLFNSLGYVPSRSGRAVILHEFFRILKEGGSLFIDVLNRWHVGEGLNFRKSPLAFLP